MSFPPSSARQVHRRYSLGVLNLLKQEIDKGHLDPTVVRAPVEAFYEAILNEMDTCLAGLFTQEDGDLKRAAERVAECVEDFGQDFLDGVDFLFLLEGVRESLLRQPCGCR